jgi:hypothetical protein
MAYFKLEIPPTEDVGLFFRYEKQTFEKAQAISQNS